MKCNWFFLLSLFFADSAWSADPKPDVKALEERIKELEDRQNVMFLQMNDEQQKRVRPFLNSDIMIGGFFETALTHLDGPNMDTIENSTNHVLGINIAAELSKNDRFVSQLQTGLGYSFTNRHNDPRTTQRSFSTATAPTLLVHAYYEHNFTELMNVQMGVGYVPFGHAYHEREPFLFKRKGGDGSQMINTAASSDNGRTAVGVAFPLWMGFHIHGSSSFTENRIGYNLYTFTPTSNTNSIGEGARIWYQLGDIVTFGISGQIGEEAKYMYMSYGADVQVKYENYGVTLEYARNEGTGNGDDGPKSYYVLPYVEFSGGKYLFYLSADYLDNPTNKTVMTGLPNDPYEKWEYGAGINWLPQANIRFRLGYTDHQYVGDNDTIIEPEERNYYSVDLSGVFAF